MTDDTEEVGPLEGDVDPAALEQEAAAASERADRVNRWLNTNRSFAPPPEPEPPAPPARERRAG